MTSAAARLSPAAQLMETTRTASPRRLAASQLDDGELARRIMLRGSSSNTTRNG
jgi:hypothetical protein